MPVKLFDGYGNPVFAYSQAEVDALNARIAELEKTNVRLEKQTKEIRSRKARGLSTN